MPNIVVIGAGVSGMTCALSLSENKDNVITVVAKHMPGDYDIEYASPWAGANFCPMSTKEHSRWEARSWPELKRLAEEVPEAGIHFQNNVVFRRQQDIDHNSNPYDELFAISPWFKDLFDEFRDLTPDELPSGYVSGCDFRSVCINTALYLPWLLGQCRKNGVIFKRATLSHIHEAKKLSHTGSDATIIINTTGLGALKLGGVTDTNLTPARGQIVLVRNESSPMLTTSGNDDGGFDVTYLMMRASGGGTILGGSYELGNWDPNPDPNLALRIMNRIVILRPEIAGGKGVAGLDVVRHAVGLRPYRAGGVRVEAERTTFDDGTLVVHNYGHSGWGYQGSYGCAERVVELVNEMTA